VAVLAIEIDDRERLAAVEGEEAFAQALTPAEDALAAEARADGVLVREGAGRWWLVAPDTDTDAARRLAHRVASTVTAHAPVRHGVPLRASIGVAVCPDDGTVAQALADHADEGVFTARALGVSVA
jgi:GGDEF domain-containing protein